MGEDLAGEEVDGTTDCCRRGTHHTPCPSGSSASCIPDFQQRVLGYAACLWKGGSEHCEEEGGPRCLTNSPPAPHLLLFCSGCCFI